MKGEGAVEKFRYNNVEERVKRMNRFFLLASSLVFLVLIFYQTMLIFDGNERMKALIWNIVLMCIFTVFNMTVMLRSRATIHFKTIVAVEMGVQFCERLKTSRFSWHFIYMRLRICSNNFFGNASSADTTIHCLLFNITVSIRLTHVKFADE